MLILCYASWMVSSFGDSAASAHSALIVCCKLHVNSGLIGGLDSLTVPTAMQFVLEVVGVRLQCQPTVSLLLAQVAMSARFEPEPGHCLSQSSYGMAALVLKQQSSVAAVAVLHASALNCQALICSVIVTTTTLECPWLDTLLSCRHTDAASC